MSTSSENRAQQLAPKRELWAWAMYDFANSGFTTVVLTAVFNVYFVASVVTRSADEGMGTGASTGTFLWSVSLAVANLLVLLSAPVLGAIADVTAMKKQFLWVTSLGCILFTALLALVQPGDVAMAMVFVILATVMFASGENLIAAFLPELAPPEYLGRLSGYGWSLGYIGGMLVLGICLVYVSMAQSLGEEAAQYVPVTMVITAVMFALAVLPTFIWLRERATPDIALEKNARLFAQIVTKTFKELRQTYVEASRFRDLFNLLASMTVYYCGIHAVIVLAAIYAQQVFGFKTSDTIMLILVVNITAAVGAFLFGILQDRIGSVKALAIALGIWVLAIFLAFMATQVWVFWLAANLVGVAMGSTQSAGRALVGQFTPFGRQGEFFGLWGMAVKLAAVIGPLGYGLLVYITDGNHRVAILSTLSFFVLGLLLLLRVNETRGRQTALS